MVSAAAVRVRRRAGQVVAVAAGAGAIAQWVPSVASLGQWAPWGARGGTWCRWRGTGPGVALTFDDGPDPVGTPAVLDALDRLGLNATFFCLGSQVDRFPDLVAAITSGGHEVASHGYRHAHHLWRSPRWIARDLDRSRDALKRVGVTPRWFRPPYGQVSGPTMVATRSRGMQLVLWSAWGREWVAPDATTVASRVTAVLAPGSIVLLHDSDTMSPPGSAARALDALGPIAEALHQRNLRALGLDELIGPRSPDVAVHPIAADPDLSDRAGGRDQTANTAAQRT